MNKKIPYPGYMMLEIGIVLALLAIMVISVMPHISWFTALTVQAELRQLADLIRYQQYIARLYHTEQTIQFTHTNSYIIDQKQYNLVQGVQFGFLKGAYGPPSDPHYSISRPITFVGNILRIGQDGSLQSGSIYVTDKAQQYCYALTVPVAHAPYFRLYRYDKGTWILLS